MLSNKFRNYTENKVMICNEEYTRVEWELKDEKEQEELWRALVKEGVYGGDIYQFNYNGNDGKFHYTTHIYN